MLYDFQPNRFIITVGLSPLSAKRDARVWRSL